MKTISHQSCNATKPLDVFLLISPMRALTKRRRDMTPTLLKSGEMHFLMLRSSACRFGGLGERSTFPYYSDIYQRKLLAVSSGRRISVLENIESFSQYLPDRTISVLENIFLLLLLEDFNILKSIKYIFWFYE